jgi:hypothetical protein
MQLELNVSYEDSKNFAILGTVTLTGSEKAAADGPSKFEVKGTWSLEGDQLVETPNESTFPLWRVGVASPATVKTLDDETFAFERSGALMTYTKKRI